ncbi:hypothetical protein [Kribbella sp.]|uniref:hypothetical protein n=1 Tax=Kribbella sp. TaxID=1871183 RepID=UPI002D328601|nr:hypothetical protein [Kribbella sp.]HZX06211.1 hypothetical protein [Kribbella sp.]
MKTLERLIVGLLAVFVLLVTTVAVTGTAQAWGIRDRGARAVSKAQVVSMQPSAGKPPVILVLGPTGSRLKVSGTEDLHQPYPSEGDYIDVVFPRTGGAVIPQRESSGDTTRAIGLIVGIWIAWCALLLVSVRGGRYLVRTLARSPVRGRRAG